MELYRYRNALFEFEMQKCTSECKNSIYNSKISFHKVKMQFENAECESAIRRYGDSG